MNFLVSFVLQFPANGRASSEIGYTTDSLYSFWDRQKAEFCMLYSFVGTIANIFGRKKLGIVNWTIEGKNNFFLPDNCHTQKRTYNLNNHP